jgi:hypothetical protein
MKTSTYVNNVQVTFENDKRIIFSFHHLKTQEECISAIYEYVENNNKKHYRHDKIKSIEFLDNNVMVITDNSEED